MTRTYAFTHAQLARDESNTVWNGNERAFSHDVSGVAAWRGVLTRYRRRSSRCSDGQACHADPVGVPLTRASRGPHNHKVADRCTSIAPDSHSRKHKDSSPLRA